MHGSFYRVYFIVKLINSYYFVIHPQGIKPCPFYLTRLTQLYAYFLETISCCLDTLTGLKKPIHCISLYMYLLCCHHVKHLKMQILMVMITFIYFNG